MNIFFKCFLLLFIVSTASVNCKNRTLALTIQNSSCYSMIACIESEQGSFVDPKTFQDVDLIAANDFLRIKVPDTAKKVEISFFTKEKIRKAFIPLFSFNVMNRHKDYPLTVELGEMNIEGLFAGIFASRMGGGNSFTLSISDQIDDISAMTVQKQQRYGSFQHFMQVSEIKGCKAVGDY